MPNCKKCGDAHYNFQKCAIAAEQSELRANRTAWMRTRPLSAPEGFRPWHKDQLNTARRYGNTVVVESGLRLSPGKLTRPKE